MRSCRRRSRSASPCTAAIAQMRPALPNRARLSFVPPFTPRAPARLVAPCRRSGRQQLLDPLGGGHFVDPLDRGKLAHQTIQCRLINLALAIGLLGLAAVAEQ